MSNLQAGTIKPFRENKNIIPKTRFGPMLDRIIGSKQQGTDSYFGEVINLNGGGRRIQYIPSDSPSVQLYRGNKDIKEKEGRGRLWDGHADIRLDELAKTWECNETDYNRNDILYTVNNNGWRCPNMNKEDDAIMFLGDSYTFGIGVGDEDNFAYKVSQQQGKACWNLGNPGGGNQEIVLLLESFLESGYVPSEVVVLWSEVHRKLIFGGDTFNANAHHDPLFYINHSTPQVEDPVVGILNQKKINELGMVYSKEVSIFTPMWGGDWTKDVADDPALPSMKAWAMMHDTHQWFDFYMIRNNLLNLCKANNIRCTELHILGETALFSHNVDGNSPIQSPNYPPNFIPNAPNFIDTGRDNAHWGPKSHEIAYETCIKLL
jgi:hypothetical protein|tara:strand:- start:987 stop:2117 length:1131 start_codon:yes stop_codon:yes gene_type:complete